MKPIVEHLELKKKNFTKWLFLGLAVLSLFALFISLDKEGNSKWICVGGVLLFGSGYWMSLKYRLITYQEGFTKQNIFRTRHVLWQRITSIKYESSYHSHGVRFQLRILYGAPSNLILLHVKQYNKNKMQRFFHSARCLRQRAN